jgi:hypothetical protein
MTLRITGKQSGNLVVSVLKDAGCGPSEAILAAILLR